MLLLRLLLCVVDRACIVYDYCKNIKWGDCVRGHGSLYHYVCHHVGQAKLIPFQAFPCNDNGGSEAIVVETFVFVNVSSSMA